METVEVVEEIFSFPLPPPWKKKTDGAQGFVYVNERTGKETRDHPAAAFLSHQQEQSQKKQDKEQTENNEGGYRFMNDEPKIPPEGNEPEVDVVWFEGVGKNSDSNSPKNTNSPAIFCPANNNAKTKAPTCAFYDYRCEWKDTGLFGERNAYGLTVRYFDDDGRTTIRFDGVDGAWHFSVLEGMRGPVERYDLFVGARLKVFGRFLTITSTTASNCAWIEAEGAKMLKRQDWLREKIESVGAVPIVRKPIIAAIKNVTRSAKPAGHLNLRKIYDENAQLQQQLFTLGLGHLIQNEGKRK